MENTEPRLFHYTVGIKLQGILKSGEIRPATVGVPKHERPAVWLTAKQDWEELCNKGISDPLMGTRVLNKEETHKEAGGLVRIEVSHDAAPFTWWQFKKKSGIGNKSAKRLAEVAKAANSNPKDWRVSFKPVTREKWLSIEIGDRAGWYQIINYTTYQQIDSLSKKGSK